MSDDSPHSGPSSAAPPPAESSPGQDKASDSHLRQLSPLLVWAVVFADIGTSVYYVPGVLYADPRIRDLAPFFIGITLVGFVLLALKYIEICWRNPDGGGVVSIASQAIAPAWGAFGGLLITISYFLTAAISTVSGLHYLGSVFPFFDEHVLLFTVLTLAVLAIVNIIGIRESATLSLLIAVAALATNFLVAGLFLIKSTPAQWASLGSTLSLARSLNTETFLVGFGGAWLAFSGLESISQLSPAMRLPIAKTAARGMWLVVGTVLATSPILTLLAIALLEPAVKEASSERFISELGFAIGGMPVRIAVVVAASSLLLFAANTAIIGSYHVFLALAERHYMPSAIALRNRRFKTPHVAILVATIVPMFVVLITKGDLTALAALYAFGLMGAFVLSSFGLDVLRWREKKRGVAFAIGVFTTLLLYVAWMVGLFVNTQATLFGLFAVGIGMLLAIGTHQKWFTDLVYGLPFMQRRAQQRVEESEQELESSERVEMLSLSQAEALSQLYPSGTLVALRSPNPLLMSEAIQRERGRGGNTLYVLYVEERTGLFVRVAPWDSNNEANAALLAATKVAERESFTVIPVWTASYNAVEGIVRAAEALGVSAVMIGVSQRGGIYHLLRGHVVNGLTKRLSSNVRLLLIG